MTPRSDLRLDQIAGLAIAGLGISWAFFQSPRLLEGSLHFGQFQPTPLRANLVLLAAGVLGGLVTTGLVALVGWLRPRAALLGAAIAAGPLVLATIAVSSAIHPGTGPYVDRETVTSRSLGEPAATFVLTVFFDHDRDTLQPEERKRIVRTFSVYRDCSLDRVRVRGFASSARYRSESDERNKLLANRRAQAVADFLDERFAGEIEPLEWGDYETMVETRRLNDVGLKQERLLDVEALNRRAEITWTDDLCFDPVAPLPEASAPQPRQAEETAEAPVAAS